MPSPDSPDLHPPASQTQRSLPVEPRPPEPALRGGKGRFSGGLADYATALVQAPADVVEDLHRRSWTLTKLVAIVLLTLSATGVVVAAMSGGLQWFVVPLKLSLGMLACSLLCLPSLYIFSSLAGASQSLRETAAALLMGVALIGILLVGLAPVSWLFSQTTGSSAVMGFIHLATLLVASWFGLALIRRVLTALNPNAVRGLGGWSVMFVLVVLQMTATLRPLVGPYEGQLIGDKAFFVDHWANELTAGPRTR